jgi:uncharacterized phiE125 gp8 family phage protein
MPMTKALVMTGGPAQEPVTLSEAKAHLRVTDDAEDVTITALIGAARSIVEMRTGRALITQSWLARFDAWPANACRPWLDLPRPPLRAVTAVHFYDATNTAQLWDPALYGVDVIAAPGRIYRAPGAVWPAPGRMFASIEIAFDAGYGDDPADVPAPLRQAILLQLAHLFENREPTALAQGAADLLAPYRVMVL